jgi:hypothetical protein
MFGPRPVHLFICLISLAVAGCANNSVQEMQSPVGSAPLRPQTVLVNDLVFSPDVAVVDRAFAARLESKLGTMTNDIVKSITAKRVNDEIVATIIVLVGAAGLNARPGSQEELTPKKGALVVTGRLHAADQSNRNQSNPVGFGAGSSVAADMTVSEISEGAEKQLLTFTAQAGSVRQPGAAIAGPSAALNAAIATVLAAKSAPDVNLSPDVEAQARGLGRAVADKIVAYAGQQGWATKSYLPALSEDTKLAKNKPENLPVAAARQSGSPSPTNTIPCKAFTKNERGHWYVKGPVTFDIGSAENQTLQDLEIPPKFFIIGGVDLYEAVQKKCGGWQPAVRLQ